MPETDYEETDNMLENVIRPNHVDITIEEAFALFDNVAIMRTMITSLLTALIRYSVKNHSPHKPKSPTPAAFVNTLAPTMVISKTPSQSDSSTPTSQALNKLKELLVKNKAYPTDLASSPIILDVDTTSVSKLLYDFKEAISHSFDTLLSDMSVATSLSSRSLIKDLLGSNLSHDLRWRIDQLNVFVQE
ncbi:hypothetical protein RIF29_25524 [Crotalaria pallida]|uniref:Uncharacterized protein n=1 Tax=Crotalaria pallida TaxID=3830 RepID=A0AAN9EML8_CROPI